MRRNIVDELCLQAIRRYKTEYPNKTLNNSFIDNLWYSIQKILITEGRAKAEEYINSVKLLDL